MKIATETLIADLVERTRGVINKAEDFKTLSSKELNWKTNENSWSILECIEHLNRYGDFYNPEIKKRIADCNTKPSDIFKSGLLGNYFAESMLPKEKLNKMKTFEVMNPAGSTLSFETLNTFIDQQKELLNLLDKSKSVNLTKTKTAISISKLIKLRLGDTFRVIIYHNQRHIVQAEKVLAAQKVK